MQKLNNICKASSSTCRCSIVVSIPACHAGDPGSIPGNGVTPFSFAATFPNPKRYLQLQASQLLRFRVHAWLFPPKSESSYLVEITKHEPLRVFPFINQLQLPQLPALLALLEAPNLSVLFVFHGISLLQSESFIHGNGSFHHHRVHQTQTEGPLAHRRPRQSRQEVRWHPPQCQLRFFPFCELPKEKFIKISKFKQLLR